MKTRVYGPDEITGSLIDKIEQFLYPHQPEEQRIYREYNPYSYHTVVLDDHQLLGSIRVIRGSKKNKLPIEYARTHTGECFSIEQDKHPACEVGGLKIRPGLPSKKRYSILQRLMDLAEYRLLKLDIKSAWITCKSEHASLYSRYKFKEVSRVFYDGEYSALRRDMI